MKVSKAIEWLSELNPDEEIVICWWNREWVEDFNGLTIASDEVWQQAMKLADEAVGEAEHLQAAIGELVSDVAMEYVNQEVAN